jgi:D-alanyl-D-alanine carboxypeptidase
MNTKAVEMGLVNTHFVNVSGVEAPDHYTSAYDITMITRSALNRSLFSYVVSTKKTTIKSLKGNNYPLISTNILLDKPGFSGVKTGWTPEAGECLVVLFEKDSHKILISILHSSDRFGEGEKIADWIFQNYTWE